MSALASQHNSATQFFLLLFALSIPFWIVDFNIDAKRSSLNFSVIDIITAFLPIITAFILTFQKQGKNGIKILFFRIIDFARIKKKGWFLVIIIMPFVIYFLIYYVLIFLDIALPADFKIPFSSIPTLFILFFIGAVCEETGYMGYAFAPLYDKYNAFLASLIIGFWWAIWHYPSIIQQQHNLYWIFWATLGTVAVRFLIVWIYQNTQQSLFACILFHAFMNLGRPLFPNNAYQNPLVDYPQIHYGLIAVIAIIIVVFSRNLFFAKSHNHIT